MAASTVLDSSAHWKDQQAQKLQDIDAGTNALLPASASEAAALNAAIPITPGASSRADAYHVTPLSPLDGQRSLQCLAEAIYFEARSESEEGQRAVAQVVINRMRHPAYPNSICGVVYQGPMRPGGGCQFTFTCDGSLARRPSGPDWARAQSFAAEAMAGHVFAPVGRATHYHTHEVVPTWAYRLVKLAVIGAHNFYRLPGASGSANAFTQDYAGREPSPVRLLASRPITLAADAALPAVASAKSAASEIHEALPLMLPEEVELQVAASSNRLPQSPIREQYLNSGSIRASH